MKNMKKIFSVMLVLVLSLALLVGCGNDTNEPENDTNVEENEENVEENEDGDEEESDEPREEGSIILSTTTSTQDSGLLDSILPKFEEETGTKVKVVAVGTGKALEMGENGEADILLVHAKSSEEEFVSEGHGTEREDVMYNDFVLVGPKDDPINLKEESPEDIEASLETISETKTPFVSRGDDSGTHKKELGIWEDAEITPDEEWYIESGSGMSDTLKIADEKDAYTLTDRATYLSLKDTLELEIAVEGDDKLFNQYGIIPVDPEKNDQINEAGAKEFMDWLLSDETQELIGEFGEEEYGQPLFVPNAK